MQLITLPDRFERTEFDAVVIGGETWLRGPQIGAALAFENPAKGVQKVWSRNEAEFDDSMTMLIQVPTAGGRQLVRLFNARGAALIAMKAQTPKGEAFRRWVLDVLEGKASVDDETPIAAGQMTPTVAARLRAMFIETPKMRHLIRYRSQGLGTTDIAKLIDVSRAYVAMQLRVAEFLGLIEMDPRLQAYRATPQFEAFIKGKNAYKERRRAQAKQALQGVAAELDGVQLLAAPTGEATDAQ